MNNKSILFFFVCLNLIFTSSVFAQIKNKVDPPRTMVNSIRQKTDTVVTSNKPMPTKLHNLLLQNQGTLSSFVTTNGIIYAGTRNGLFASYDNGLSFKKLKNLNTDFVGEVVSIFVDTKGIIYAGTEGGLFTSVNAGKTFTHLAAVKKKSTAIHDRAQSVFIGSNGTICVGLNPGGLVISRDGGKTFFNARTRDSMGWSPEVWSTFIDSKGSIYAMTNDGLAISRDNGKAFTVLQDLGDSQSVNSVFVDSNGGIYLSTAEGVAISQNAGKSFTVHKNGLPSTTVLSVAVNSKGRIYVGTDRGIAISNDGGNSFSKIPGIDQYTHSIFIDSKDLVYASTDKGLEIIR